MVLRMTPCGPAGGLQRPEDHPIFIPRDHPEDGGIKLPETQESTNKITRGPNTEDQNLSAVRCE
jgi:hypothetical protein